MLISINCVNSGGQTSFLPVPRSSTKLFTVGGPRPPSLASRFLLLSARRRVRSGSGVSALSAAAADHRLPEEPALEDEQPPEKKLPGNARGPPVGFLSEAEGGVNPRASGRFRPLTFKRKRG